MRCRRFSSIISLIFILFFFCLSLRIQDALAMLTTEDYEKNRVIVRVWHFTGINPNEGERVGHVSVQIPSFKDEEGGYISFWPERQRRAFFDLVPGKFNGLIKDYDDEEAPPDTIVSLYTLNPGKIKERFLEFKERVKNDSDGKETGWAICGDCRFVSKGSQQHSCASIALTLLKSGDLSDLFLSSVLPTKQKVSYSLQSPADKVVKTNPSIVCPNDVADIAIKARKLERTTFNTIQKIPLYEDRLDLRKISPFYKYHLEKESPYVHEAPPGLLTIVYNTVWREMWKKLGYE